MIQKADRSLEVITRGGRGLASSIARFLSLHCIGKLERVAKGKMKC